MDVLAGVKCLASARRVIFVVQCRLKNEYACIVICGSILNGRPDIQKHSVLLTR